MAEAARVRPMTDEEFARWWEAMLAAYSDDIRAARGVDDETARVVATRQSQEVLPEGRDTPHSHLLTVLDDDGAAAGILWVGPHPQRPGAGWVYDIRIDEDRRGEGLGRATMLAAEQVCRDEGWAELGLNVFGPNARARGLYESLGYEPVSIAMLKAID